MHSQRSGHLRDCSCERKPSFPVSSCLVPILVGSVILFSFFVENWLLGIGIHVYMPTRAVRAGIVASVIYRYMLCRCPQLY